MTTHEIEVKDAVFLKVSTNQYGGLRFKASKETEAVKLYAEEISTDRQQLTAKDVEKLSGFKITEVKDKSVCLCKTSKSASSENSSKESSE